MSSSHALRYASITLQVEGSALHEIEMMKRDLVLRHGSLGEPVDMPAGGKKLDLWDRLSETQKMETAQLRKICDVLGFVIIPFDYLDPRSYQNESIDLQNGIQEFASRKDFQAYVLCPVSHYSFDRHIRSSDVNKPIYAGRHSQIFMSFQISMPFLRSVLMDIKSLKGQVRDVNTRLSAVEESIKTVSRTLEDLQRQVGLQQQEMAFMRINIAKEKDLQRQAEDQKRKATIMWRQIFKEMEARGREAKNFCASDPLMFIVEKKIDIKSGNEIAFIGPYWGPDFDDIVLVATGLKKIKGQRNYIQNTINRVWIR